MRSAFACFWGLHGRRRHLVEGMPVYPGSGEDAYARDVLPGHYKHFGADLVITLLDIWVLDPAQLAGMNVLHWMPVDCEPLSSLDRRVLDGPGRPVAFSRFGHRQLEAAGYKPLYAPHALDMSVWEPLDDRDKAREMLGFDGQVRDRDQRREPGPGAQGLLRAARGVPDLLRAPRRRADADPHPGEHPAGRRPERDDQRAGPGGQGRPRRPVRHRVGHDQRRADGVVARRDGRPVQLLLRRGLRPAGPAVARRAACRSWSRTSRR